MARQRRPLSDTRLRAFREGLIEERAQLVGNVEGLDAEADVKNWRESGFDDDPADAGSASFERETAQSLSLHARNLLSQIEDALRRLDVRSIADLAHSPGIEDGHIAEAIACRRHDQRLHC